MEVMSSLGFLKVGSALAFVVALAFFIAFLGKKSGVFKQMLGQSSDSSSLNIVHSLMIDPKRRLVVVNWGDEEHLILLGVQTETLIKSKSAGSNVSLPLSRKDFQ